MTRLFAVLSALTASLVLAAAVQAQDPLRVDVTRGNLDPLPIALPNFVGVSDEAQSRGADITRVVTNDLASSGLYRGYREYRPAPPLCRLARDRRLGPAGGYGDDPG